MFRLLLVVLLFSSNYIGFTQHDGIKGLISMVEARVLYRGYDNRLEVFTCEDCDSIYISSLGAKVTMLDKVQFIVRPKTGLRDLTLAVQCVKGEDTTVLWRRKYNIKNLPKPKIYLGGIDVNEDFNHVIEFHLFKQERFTARYDETVDIIGAKFTVLAWSIKVGKTTFTNESALLTKEFKKAFTKARKGTKVYFDYVTVISPDGIAQRIKLDQTYYKKAKRNAEYEIEQKSWVHPESGG